MGCCVSTHKKGTAGNPKHHDHNPISPPSNHHAVSKSPPRAEEEAVKEVLSETPLAVIPAKTDNPDPSPNPNPNPYYYTPIPKINHGAAAANGFPTAILAGNNHRSASPRKRVHHPTGEVTRLPSLEAGPHPKILSPPSPAAAAGVVTPDEISEVSEISCLSESVSTATACDGEVRQRVPRSPSPGRIHKASSFSADPAVRRERITGKSPVRRSDPSPRRTGPGQIVVRNRVGGPGIGDGQRKRELGENSRRRSRSPATRNEAVVSRSNVSRSPSGRKTALSPGRVRMVHPGSGSGGGGADGCESKGEDNEWDPNPTVPSESLENPLVSLECFIFL